MKFEAHITLPTAAHFVAAKGFGESKGWHFSKIDGDEVMGEGVNGYLTKSSDDLYDLMNDMEYMKYILNSECVDYSRLKIEVIILDERI